MPKRLASRALQDSQVYVVQASLQPCSSEASLEAQFDISTLRGIRLSKTAHPEQRFSLTKGVSSNTNRAISFKTVQFGPAESSAQAYAVTIDEIDKSQQRTLHWLPGKNNGI